MEKEWKVPAFEQIPEPEGKKNNILVLALSTIGHDINGVISPSYCSCDVPGWEVTDTEYFYQQEPIPMMLTQRLKRKGEQIDEIIMICTPETCKEDKAGTRLRLGTGNSMDAESEVYLRSAVGQNRGVSARDYFAASVREYVHREGHGKEPWFYEIDYQESGGEASQAEVVSALVAELRKHADANIYIDTHGGPRASQEVTNSVLSLLRAEGIRIKADHIFSLEYSRPHGKIVQAGLALDILDFVTGMSELMNYGRADTLDRFVNKDRANENDKKIIDAVGEIAVAMQFCDVARFEAGLTKLTTAMCDRNKSPEGNNVFLNIFIENIKSNYAELLPPERTVIDEILWCKDKGFYQQVLTLIESRIPGFLHQKEAFRYPEELGQRVRDNIRNEDPDNFLFNNTVAPLMKKEDRLKYLRGEGADLRRDFSRNWSINKQEETIATVNVFVEGNKMKQFVKLHLGLKELRNLYNHAFLTAGNTDIPLSERDAFEEKIDEYISLVEELTCQPRAANRGNVIRVEEV